MVKNTTPELYDEIGQESSKLTNEEILMSENDILDGILSLGKRKDDAENYRMIRLKDGKGKVKLEFRVRPLSEDENRTLVKKATPTARNKKVKPEPDWVKYRSLVIYSATVNEDRLKTWDSQKVKDAMDVIDGWEIIDKMMLAGEKEQIIAVIDELSGYGLDEAGLEDEAGN
jgi:hypothetical protein